jgi:SAM-dependent methyltransferase
MASTPDQFPRFSHRRRKFNSPVGELRLGRIFELLQLEQAEVILDLGCGTGEWLLRSLALAGPAARGTGIDMDGQALDEAATRALGRGLDKRVEWRCEDASAALPALAGSFDRLLCVGASHAFGGYEATLRALASAGRPGGRILIGEGFWHRPPEAEYLQFLGGEDEIKSHAENVARGESVGLEAVWATTASLDEWDDFEWSFYSVAAEFAAVHPGPESAELLVRRRRWRDCYLRWGRGTMGFGYYVFRMPASTGA